MDGLFIIDCLGKSQHKSFYANKFPTVFKDTLANFHLRFNHLPKPVILSIIKANSGLILINPLEEIGPCTDCLITKAQQLPFPNFSSTEISQVGQLLSADLVGPLPITSLGGAKFLINIIDAYSNYVFSKPISNKNNASGFIKQVIQHLKIGHINVLIFRTDNGGEFLNNDLTNFFNDNGINHHRTIPYTSQQNGRVERIN